MVPEPKHGAVSLWKTSPHGERIWVFLGGVSWLETFNFCAFLANLSGFQLLIRCVFIGMKEHQSMNQAWMSSLVQL